MKVLYAIQGSGNGHISRAKEIIPALKNRVQVDVLISGTQVDLDLPFPVKYRFKGVGFVFGKRGGINYYQTLRNNNIFRIIKEIRQCDVKQYDLIINDFEPISAWASYLRNTVNCVSLSHQYALLYPSVPKPKKRSFLSSFLLRNYAPSTIGYGLHFKSYSKSIFPAIIRSDIRKQSIKHKNYYVVYLPAYSDERIIKVLSKIKKSKWKVYSKHAKEDYKVKSIQVKSIRTSKSFETSLSRCKGVICGAGFETPAEALYLNKKLMVVPMKGQYDQRCNAESLRQLGVEVLSEFNESKLYQIMRWMNTKQSIHLQFPDKTQFIIDEIISNHILATELSHRIFQET